MTTKLLAFAALGMMAAGTANAQTAANAIAFQGLAPVSLLNDTPAGRAALAANGTVTSGIHTGAIKLPMMMAFVEQQRQALADATITSSNASQLADGLGSRLGGLYQILAPYPDKGPGISPNIAALFAYTNAVTASDSNAAKYFFANGTRDGKTALSPVAASILPAIGGITDVFGAAYALKAGQAGADPYGNSRPFQTGPLLIKIEGRDYYGAPSSNIAYLRGPAQNLVDSPSFPSGHTTYGTMESLLLALMAPERFQQEITRAAEYGNDRIILGAHYAMDVIAGRTLALHDVAQLLSNNPAYVGQSLRGQTPITDYPAALRAARTDLVAALQVKCGQPIAVCAAGDNGRFSIPAANEAFYDATQTYGLPVVYPRFADSIEDFAKIAPEAGLLLTTAFPHLTLAQADAILTETEGPGGGFLDNGSSFGLYSRLNLYAAGKRAAAMAP